MNRRSLIIKASLVLAGSCFKINEAFAFSVDFLKKKYQNFYTPENSKFHQLKKTFNTLIIKRDPFGILFPKKASEISSFLKETKTTGQKILMRSGGHSYASFSTGEGIVLDSRNLRQFYELENNVIKTSSGMVLSSLNNSLDEINRSFPVGAFPSVGIAGYLLGGGHSRRSRFYGLGADNVSSMDVILANGDKLHNVSPSHYGDLFWAMLGGGGGNFAFVESFTLDTKPKTKDYFFKFVFNGSHLTKASEIFSFWEKESSFDSSEFATNLTVYIQNGYIKKMIVSGLRNNVSKDKNELDFELKNSKWGELFNFEHSHFESSISHSNDIKETTIESMSFKGSSHYANSLIGKIGFEDIQSSIAKHTKGMSLYMGFYSLGGEIKKPKREISFPHRNSLYMVDLFSNFRADRSRFSQMNQKFNNHYTHISHLFSGGAYVNYPNLDFENWAEKYYGKSLSRLLTVKKRYDPDNRFNYGPQSLSSLLI